MGWLYTFVRTFPFWAIPLGIALITGWLSSGKHGKQKSPKLWIVIGIFLIITSVIFLVFKGHETAVPWIQEMIQSN